MVSPDVGQLLIALAFVAVAGLGAAGALHIYWAVGGTWPGSDRSDLARKVVGSTDDFPSAGLTYAVAGLLLVAALVIGGATGLWPLPVSDRLVEAVAWVVVAVLLIRAVAGLAASGLREARGRGTMFTHRDLRIYSPLILGIGLFALLSLLTID